MPRHWQLLSQSVPLAPSDDFKFCSWSEPEFSVNSSRPCLVPGRAVKDHFLVLGRRAQELEIETPARLRNERPNQIDATDSRSDFIVFQLTFAKSIWWCIIRKVTCGGYSFF